MARSKAGRPPNLERRKTGPGFALSDWFHRNLDRLTDMTNEEIAESMGYSRPNIISMWRTGRTKIPLDRLVDLSKILNVDLVILLPLWLEQYIDAEGYGEIKKAQSRLVSEEEGKIIQILRDGMDNLDYHLNSNMKHILISCMLVGPSFDEVDSDDDVVWVHGDKYDEVEYYEYHENNKSNKSDKVSPPETNTLKGNNDFNKSK